MPGATGSQILGNYIGTNQNGDANLGNMQTGVQVLSVSNITIGSTTGTGRNVIVSNGNNGTDPATNGIIVFSSTAAVAGVQIVNNYLGVAPDGVTARQNFHGIGFNSVGGFNITGTVIDRNVISGNAANGINLGNSFIVGTVITGNTIGLNALRTAAVPNGNEGIFVVGPNAVIGGATAAAANVISGNGKAGVFFSTGGNGGQVLGNLIGTNASGAALGNGSANGGAGIGIVNNVSGLTIGSPTAGNTIAFNAGHGINVETGTNNAIRGNNIYSNGALGIDLGNDGSTANDAGDGDTGPNNFQNFPIVTSATGSTDVAGTLNSTATTQFALDFFANPACGPTGRRYLGSGTTTTDGSGNASFNVSLSGASTVGEFITATATDPSGNTSEFSSSCATVIGAPNLAVTTARAPASPLIGSPITYTLTVTNNGTAAATNVTLVDTLPATAAFMSYTNANGTCSNASGVVTCGLGTLESRPVEVRRHRRSGDSRAVDHQRGDRQRGGDGPQRGGQFVARHRTGRGLWHVQRDVLLGTVRLPHGWCDANHPGDGGLQQGRLHRCRGHREQRQHGGLHGWQRHGRVPDRHAHSGRQLARRHRPRRFRSGRQARLRRFQHQQRRAQPGARQRRRDLRQPDAADAALHPVLGRRSRTSNPMATSTSSPLRFPVGRRWSCC